MTVDKALRRHAQQQPSKVAVCMAERSITYTELDASVTALARYLLDRGLRAGDRVAVHWSNSIEAVQLLLATFRAGLVAVPINLRLKVPEIAYMFEHSSAHVCFSEPALAAIAEEARCGSRPEIVPELPPLSTIPRRLAEVDPGQPAVILYTSGTTARPKGVTHTHRSLVETTTIISAVIPVGPDDTQLVTTPLMHASCLNVGLLTALYQGATEVLLRTFDPAAVLDLIERFRCTHIWGLPAMLQFVVEEQARHPRDVSSVHAAGAGGDSVPAALQRRFHGVFQVQLREGLGLTESCLVTANPSSDIRIGSIGLAAPGVDIRLIDLQGNDVPPGETGEILVRSPANCVGYWNDPTATASLFRDGWMHTGDLASCDEDGYYWFKGRLKQLIIHGGSNVSPQEVEEVLYLHPAVLEAGVIGAPNSVYGEIVVAFISLREGHQATPEELQQFARQRLADYKVPEKILYLDQLPKGPTGKVHRRALKEMLLPQFDLGRFEVGSQRAVC
jgi:long-chain acyl-CoA synthetase